MARAAVLSVATSVAPIMTFHGRTTATATAYPMATSTPIAATIHGNQRRMLRHSTAVATAVLPQHVPWKYAAIATAILQYAAIATDLGGNRHGNFHARQSNAISLEPHGTQWPSAAIATAILQYLAIPTEIHGKCHGNFFDVKPLLGPRHFAAIALPHSAPVGGNCHSKFYMN